MEACPVLVELGIFCLLHAYRLTVNAIPHGIRRQCTASADASAAGSMHMGTGSEATRTCPGCTEGMAVGGGKQKCAMSWGCCGGGHLNPSFAYSRSAAWRVGCVASWTSPTPTS